MRLIVTTPTAIAVDENSRAPCSRRRSQRRLRHRTGPCGFSDHAFDLRRAMARWRRAEHYVAVRGGVLRVREGKVVEIATREAVVNDDLAHLRREVLAAMAQNVEAERSARSGALEPGTRRDSPNLSLPAAHRSTVQSRSRRNSHGR